MDYSQQVAGLETADDVIRVARTRVDAADKEDKEDKEVRAEIALMRARGDLSAERDRIVRMVEMRLDARMDKVWELRRLISEVEAETHRNRGKRPVARYGLEDIQNRGYCNYDTQSTAPHWWELVILPDGAGDAA